MAAVRPPAASCVTAMTPALLASSAYLQSDGINKADQYREQTLLDTEMEEDIYLDMRRGT